MAYSLESITLINIFIIQIITNATMKHKIYYYFKNQFFFLFSISISFIQRDRDKETEKKNYVCK